MLNLKDPPSPRLAAFEDMHMEVQPPEPWQPRRRQAATAGASGATARVQPAAA